MVAPKLNGTPHRFADVISGGEALPEIEILDGQIVRRKIVPGLWPLCGSDELKGGMQQRSIDLCTPCGGKMRFYVWLEDGGDGYVYSHVAMSKWISRDYRKHSYEVTRALAVKAEWLAIQMV